MKEIEDANGGIASGVLDFLDWGVLRWSMFGFLEDATKRSERVGSDTLATLMSEDFSKNPEALEEIINSYKEEGIFTSDNLFALMNGMAETENAGYSRWADFTQAIAVLGVADLAPLAIKGGVSAARAAKAGVSAEAMFAAGAIASQGTKGVMNALRATNPIGLVGALKGQRGAGNALKGLFTVGGKLNDLDGSIMRHMSRDAYDPAVYATIKPSSGVAERIFVENEIIEGFLDADAKGLLGRDQNFRAIKQEAGKVANELSENMGFPMNAAKVTPKHVGFGGWRVQVDIGKVSDGNPFKTKLATNGRLFSLDNPNAFAHELEDGSGWVVRIEQDLSTDKLTPDSSLIPDELGVARAAFAKLFGASGEREATHLAQLRNMGEAGMANLGDIIKPTLNRFLAANGEERAIINKVMETLRDGDPTRGIGPKPLYFTKSEFIAEYGVLSGGKTPSDKAVDAYYALIDLSNADWYIKASRARKKYVDLGYSRLELGSTIVKGRPVENVPGGSKVFDVKTGAYVTLKQRKNKTVYALSEGFGENNELFVINPNTVRPLQLSDVLTYNAGGTRTRPDANFFVGSISPTVTGKSRFKALFHAFSSKDASAGRQALNDIVDIIQKGYKELGVGDLKSLKGTAYADDIDSLLVGNKWNVDVEDLDDLIKLSDDTGHSFAVKFGVRGKNENIGEVSDDLAKANMSYGEAIDLEINTSRTTRGLMEYGSSSKGRIVDPAQAMSAQLDSSAFYLANKAYTQNAVTGWVKAAKASKLIDFPKTINENDFFSLFDNVKMENIPRSTEQGRKLAEMKSIIERRLGMQSRASRMFEGFATQAQEFVFDSKVLGKKTPKLNLKDSDPGSALLKVGFYTKFGFMNVAQLFMQGIHMTTVAAITPMGAKGAALSIPLNIMMSMPKDSAMYKLALKRFQKFDETNGSDLAELVDYYRATGRWHTGSDVPELQGASTIIPNGVNKVKRTAGTLMNFGLAPFTQGERLSRSTAIATAFFEFKAKHPNISVTSDFAKTWISAREQRLTFNMTTSNKAALFDGVMRVPTQWLTYTFRAMEAVFIGRGFSAGERARLALVLGPMYGLTGVGLAGFTDTLLGEDNMDVTSGQYLTLKYGIMDALAREMMGEDTSFATRLAPVAGLADTMEKIYDGEFLKVVFGPSSEISADIVKNTYQAMSNLISGNKELAKQDLAQAFQNISTFNNYQKAQGIWHYGQLRSRDNTIIPGEFSEEDGWLQLFGFSPLEVEETYSNNFKLITSDRTVRDLTDELTTMARNGIILIESDDEDEVKRGMQIFSEIDAVIQGSPITVSNQNRVRRSILEDNAYRFADLSYRLMKGGNVTAARMMDEFTINKEQDN